MRLVTSSSAAVAGALPLILLGAGGHAKVVLALARALGRDVIGVCDPTLARAGTAQWRDLPVLGDDDALASWSPAQVELANGIGQLPTGKHVRKLVHERHAEQGFHFPVLVHPAAIVDPSATIGSGAQIMAGAVLQADVTVGVSSIVNTGARIDHDCIIGRHAHVAPGAVLCGGVRVGDQAFLGAGCTVLPLVAIGMRCLVAAGAVLARGLDDEASFLPHRANCAVAAGSTPGGQTS